MTINRTKARRAQVVVPLDFGTYSSGFGWVVINERNNDAAGRRIHQVSQWPGQRVAYPKTLTCLLLDGNNDVVAWGSEADRMWQEIRLAPDSALRFVHGFKMSLAPRPDDHPESSAINDAEPDVIELITKYLQKMYRMAVTEVGKSGYTEDDIRWCLTVPAMWNDYQKQVMRQAAHAAGFPREEGRLMLALEPEAAAHYARVAGVNVLSADRKTSVDLCAEGTRFIVADCGGGTVDLTAYTSEADGGMSEIGSAAGDKTGSYYLNLEFERQILVTRLGGQAEYERLQRVCPVALQEILDRWEQAKLSVTVDKDRPIHISLPFSLSRQLGANGLAGLAEMQVNGIDDAIVITAAEVRTIFESIIPPLLSLVDAQIDVIRKQVDKDDGKEIVLLAGGFASSPYLQQRMAEHLADRATVVVTPDPAAAVLIGAGHFAYEPQTRRRRTQHTYAQGMARRFNHDRDDPKTLIKSWDGRDLCSERLGIVVRAGDSIATSETRQLDCLPIRSDQTEIEVSLFRTNDREPRYVSDTGCDLIGTMSIDLHEVMHLDISQRGVRTQIFFGETEIRATATLLGTGQTKAVTFDFIQR